MLTEYEECKQALVDALKTYENVVLEHIFFKAIHRSPYIQAVRSVTDKDIIAYVFNPSTESILHMHGMANTEDARERINSLKGMLEIPVAGDDFAEVHIITEAELSDLSVYAYREGDSEYHIKRKHAKTVIITAEIIEIKHPFYGWSKVENFRVEEGNTHYIDINGVLFDAAGKILLKYPEGRDTSVYTVPDGVIEIKKNAFSDYRDMITRFAPGAEERTFEVRIPASITDIGDLAFNSNTHRLAAIHVHKDNPHFTSQEGVLYDKAMETLICCPAGFPECEFIVPGTVKKIYREGFSGCIKLKHIILPVGLAEISKFSFEECMSLLDINIPGTVKVISSFSFSYCFKLMNVILNEGTESIDRSAFEMSNFLKNIIIPRSVTKIEFIDFSISKTSITIHCYDGSYAHSYALEHDISFALIGDNLPCFDEDKDTIPGELRFVDKSDEVELMGNPEVAKQLEKISGMIGPIIVQKMKKKVEKQ